MVKNGEIVVKNGTKCLNTCFEPKTRNLGHFWRFRAALVSKISGLRLVGTPYPPLRVGPPLQNLGGTPY